MKKNLYQTRSSIYSYIPPKQRLENTLTIELELPLAPIYYTKKEVVPEQTSSVRVYNLFGDDKI